MSANVYRCPNCSAPHEVLPGDVAIKCRYCNTTFRTFEEENRFITPVYYDSSKAIENFLLWVRKQTGYEESLPFHINLAEVRLHFYPFWVASVKASTVFKGLGEYAEYSMPDPRGGYRQIRTLLKPESGGFERFFEITLPASKDVPLEPENLAVSRVRKFFSHEYVKQVGGILHGATLSREEAGNVAVNAAKNELTRLIMREVVKVNERSDEVLLKDLTLVYLPTWSVSYEFRGKKYNAMIDASSARVISATYPPDIAEKTAYVGVGVVHGVAGAVLAFLLMGFGWLPSLTAFSGFIVAAAVYVWRGLTPTRAGEEVDGRSRDARWLSEALGGMLGHGN
ncbi:MAG: hypothetical protein QXO30_07150 [Candidatus Caldarchaeum sp.]